MNFIDLVLHLDQTLVSAAQLYGPWLYAILFVVIFCETGLVVTPFLPGDSLLFAAGALAGVGILDPLLLWVLMALAAILGDTVNYVIGREFGERIMASGRVRVLKPEYVHQTEDFFERHGGKTIIIARFFPIVRTVAPFMAGIGHMRLTRFWSFNIIGGLAWVTLFLGAGYFFGNIPVVKDNLTIGILVMVAISFIPSIYHAVRTRRQSRRAATATAAEDTTPQ
jgi:membrane-associated protein